MTKPFVTPTPESEAFEKMFYGTQQWRDLPHNFLAVRPQPDTDELCAKGHRLMIKFPIRWQPGEPVETIRAPTGVLAAGWVIGIQVEKGGAA